MPEGYTPMILSIIIPPLQTLYLWTVLVEGFQARCRVMEDVRVNRKLRFGLNVTDKLGGGFCTPDGCKSNVG